MRMARVPGIAPAIAVTSNKNTGDWNRLVELHRRNQPGSSCVQKNEGVLMRTLKISLIASLIGTAAGFWAWKLDLTKMFWPAHPQLAAFFSPSLLLSACN
jgi:hypothetical protein